MAAASLIAVQSIAIPSPFVYKQFANQEHSEDYSIGRRRRGASEESIAPPDEGHPLRVAAAAAATSHVRFLALPAAVIPLDAHSFPPQFQTHTNALPRNGAHKHQRDDCCFSGCPLSDYRLGRRRCRRHL